MSQATVLPVSMFLNCRSNAPFCQTGSESVPVRVGPFSTRGMTTVTVPFAPYWLAKPRTRVAIRIAHARLVLVMSSSASKTLSSEDTRLLAVRALNSCESWVRLVCGGLMFFAGSGPRRRMPNRRYHGCMFHRKRNLTEEVRAETIGD